MYALPTLEAHIKCSKHTAYNPHPTNETNIFTAASIFLNVTEENYLA